MVRTRGAAKLDATEEKQGNKDTKASSQSASKDDATPSTSGAGQSSPPSRASQRIAAISDKSRYNLVCSLTYVKDKMLDSEIIPFCKEKKLKVVFFVSIILHTTRNVKISSCK